MSGLRYLEEFRKGLGMAPDVGLDMAFIQH